MLDGTLEDVRDNLHVAMRVGSETLAGLHSVFVDHPQGPKARVGRVVIVGKRKSMAGIEPSVVGPAPLIGTANREHVASSPGKASGPIEKFVSPCLRDPGTNPRERIRGDGPRAGRRVDCSQPMIRFAGPADVATLHALILELARYEKLEQEVAGTEGLLRTHLFGPRPFAEALVSEDAGAIVGFALFFHTYSTFLGRPSLYLEDLFVLPQHRRRGHGRALIREVACKAVERGCGRFEWSVLDWNAPAIAFYRSLGATIMRDWRICRVTGDALSELGRRGG
jgi:GNAT superfamily N-acetyltransferase